MRTRGRLAGLIFALVWLSCAWFGAWEWNPNSSTRLFAAIAMVEDGSARIDRYAPLTIDKAQFGDHFYLDKAPGVTLMALPAVAVADDLSGERGRDVSLSLFSPPAERFLRLRMRLATASGAAVLTALAAVCVFLMGSRTGGSNAAGAFAAVAFALGTPMWGWSTSLFGHAPVAHCFAHRRLGGVARHAGGAAVAAACGRGGGGARLGGGGRVSGGHRRAADRRLGAGAAVAVRAGGAGAGGGGGGAAGAGGAGDPAGLHVFAFGDPFRLGYQGVVGFDGMKQGLFGLTWPEGTRLWGVTLGLRRGMLWVAPVLLLAAPGIRRLLREPEGRDLGWLAIVGGITFFFYNAAYFYWDGGNSTGPRHAVPAIAFLSIGFAPAWAAVRSGAARAAMLAVLALSVTLNLVIASAEITSGGPGDNPLWSDVIVGRFWAGQLRTVPNEWFGWTAWSGLFAYIAIAAVIAGAIVLTLRAEHRAVG